MEPLLPSDPQLDDLAVSLLQEAGALGAAIPDPTRLGLAGLLRMVNCYYSNRIEGHDTRPADIERAMHAEYASDSPIRALQREARAHVEVQELMEGWLSSDPALDIGSAAFLCRIHREFYDRVPDEFRFVEDAGRKTKVPVVPGELRDREVVVGRHRPPESADLEKFLRRFDEAYDPGDLGRVTQVVAMAASHHRLMWIHPFLDGNGRVTRLFSHAYAIRAGIGGLGLWSASRGLARRRSDYLAALDAADAPRSHDLDGRGQLSVAALREFTTFFLEVCLDQVIYMRQTLQLDKLGERIVGYAALRARGNALRPPLPTGGEGAPSFRESSGLLLREVMLRGEVARGEAARVLGLGERVARSTVSSLVAEGLLVSPTSRSPLRLGFPTHAVGYWLPGLYPEG